MKLAQIVPILAMRDEYRSLMMGRLSLPQRRSASVRAGSGSSL